MAGHIRLNITRAVLPLVLFALPLPAALASDATAELRWTANGWAMENFQWDGVPKTGPLEGNMGGSMNRCIASTVRGDGSQNVPVKISFSCWWQDLVLDKSGASWALDRFISEQLLRQYVQFYGPVDPKIQTGIVVSASGSTDGYHYVKINITKWRDVPKPTSCSLKGGDIDLGSVRPDESRTAGTTLTIKCNADTEVTVKVGARDGGAEVAYTPGGSVRMSFAESPGGGSNVYRVHANKNQSIDATVRATTVPGSAAPGTYTASAVVTAELQ